MKLLIFLCLTIVLIYTLHAHREAIVASEHTFWYGIGMMLWGFMCLGVAMRILSNIRAIHRANIESMNADSDAENLSRKRFLETIKDLDDI